LWPKLISSNRLQDHIGFLATMEPQVFLYILSSISEGLTALGGNLNYLTGSVATQSHL
jgi:exportin-7